MKFPRLRTTEYVPSWFRAGDACRTQNDERNLRDQSVKERRDKSGRRCRMHIDREKSPGAWAPVSDIAPFLLSN